MYTVFNITEGENMKTLLTVLTLTLATSSAYADSTDEFLAVYLIGTSVSQQRTHVYVEPDPLRINRPSYDITGTINPLSKGGSHNPYRTVYTDAEGNVKEIVEYEDIYGVKHIEVRD